MINEQYYDREKLYAEVWGNTMVALCKQYGVSNSALVKACETLNVPRPPSGYWTKKDFGKAPPPSKLPPFENPPCLLIHPPEVKKEKKPAPVRKNSPQKPAPKPKPANEEKEVKQAIEPSDLPINNESKPIQAPKEKPKTMSVNWRGLIPTEGIVSPQTFEDAILLIEKEMLPEMAITVSHTTEKEHIYVRNTRLALEKKIKELKEHPSTDNYRQVQCHGKDLFDVNVGTDSMQRAINILQALCDAFEKRGFDLVSEWNENRQYSYIYVVIMGEKTTFSIRENSKKIATKNKDSHLDYDHILTGKLTLQNLYPPDQMQSKHRWSDTVELSLEERLNDIMAAFIFSSAWKKENTERRKKEEEERKRREAIRQENERLVRIEKQRVVNLRLGTEYWVQYQNMVAFLAAVKKAYRKSAKKNSDTVKWIRWATNYLAEYKAAVEELIRYDVKEYEEKTSNFRPIYNPPPEEPYNYWKRPWYLRRK